MAIDMHTFSIATVINIYLEQSFTRSKSICRSWELFLLNISLLIQIVIEQYSLQFLEQKCPVPCCFIQELLSTSIELLYYMVVNPFESPNLYVGITVFHTCNFSNYSCLFVHHVSVAVRKFSLPLAFYVKGPAQIIHILWSITSIIDKKSWELRTPFEKQLYNQSWRIWPHVKGKKKPHFVSGD